MLVLLVSMQADLEVIRSPTIAPPSAAELLLLLEWYQHSSAEAVSAISSDRDAYAPENEELLSSLLSFSGSLQSL